MADIISFQAAQETRAVEKDEAEPAKGGWLSAACKCLACKHEWMNVMPVGEAAHDIVCPKCDTRRGQMVYPVEAPSDTLTWEHHCGGSSFTPVYIKKTNGHMAKPGEEPALRTGRSHFAELRLMCHGCGESLDPFTMLDG